MPKILRLPINSSPSLQGVSLSRLFSRHNIHVRTQNSSLPAIHCNDLDLSQRLGQALAKAKGLQLELAQGIDLSPQNWLQLLEHSVQVAQELKTDLIAMSAYLDGNDVVVEPRSFSGEVLARNRVAGLETALQALTLVGEQLGEINSKTQAEAIVVKILFDSFHVAEMKVYDVSDGQVKIAHSWKNGCGQQGPVSIPGAKLGSHFSDWRVPDSSEAMYEVATGKADMVFIEEPDVDPRVVSETKPFVLIGERLDGKLTRVYKVDWATAWDHQVYARTIKGAFMSLAERKENIINERIERFFNEIQNAILDSSKTLETKLEAISNKIARFFEINDNNGNIEMPQRVTIMLHDKDADFLVTRVIWDKDSGVQLVNHFNGPDNQGVGRRIFDKEMNENLRNLNDWSSEGIQWRRGGRGSLLATVVKSPNRKLGVITISSDRENAFTSEQKMVLDRLARNIAPTFEAVIENLDQLKVHESYAELSLKNSKLKNKVYYNKLYLLQILEANLAWFREKGIPVSLLFIDIDHFGALNNVWVHDDVDYVLAEIFAQIMDRLRDGELYRVGGEELAVRVPVDIEGAKIIAKRLLNIGGQPMTIYVPYEDWSVARDRVNDLKKVITQTAIVDAAKKRAVLAGREFNLESDLLVEERSVHPVALSNLGHGVLAAELLAGRDGKPMLKVLVQKTFSIGVVSAEKDSNESAESFFKKADTLESRAKHGGKGYKGRNLAAAETTEGTIEFIAP